jgi:hypothetical protein
MSVGLWMPVWPQGIEAGNTVVSAVAGQALPNAGVRAITQPALAESGILARSLERSNAVGAVVLI